MTINAPTASSNRLLQMFSEINKIDDINLLKAYAKELSEIPLSSWVGYDILLWRSTVKPEITFLNKHHRNNIPLIIKYGEEENAEFWVYGLDDDKQPTLTKMSEEVYHLCQDENFQDTPTSNKQLPFPLVLAMMKHHYHTNKAFFQTLDRIDPKTIDKIYSILVLMTPYRLLPFPLNILYRYFVQTSRGDESYPWASIFLYTNERNLKYRPDIVNDAFITSIKEITHQFLLNKTIDPLKKINFLLTLSNDNDKLKAILKIANQPSTPYPFSQVLQLILNNHSGNESLVLLSELKLINPLLFKNRALSMEGDYENLVTATVNKFKDQLEKDQLTEKDIKMLFLQENSNTAIHLQTAQALSHFINDDSHDENLRAKIFMWAYQAGFYKVFLYNETKDFDNLKTMQTSIYNNTFSYLTKNYQHHKILFDKPDIAFIHCVRMHKFPFKTAEKTDKASLIEFCQTKANVNQSELFQAMLAKLSTTLMKDDREKLPEEVFKILTANLYKESLNDLSQMIFFEKDKKEEVANKKNTQITPRIISNNNRYVKRSSIGAHGKALYLDNNTKSSPIGYNIHLPPKENTTKAIYVKVYGGKEATNRNKGRRPNQLSHLEKMLLANDVAVITLNLPDLLKLDRFQGMMSEALYKEIQACIHKFYLVLKNNPQRLHPSLKELKTADMKIILAGDSFGGAMTIRHAEEYQDYDAYISHDGWLSHAMSKKSSPPIATRDIEFSPWLDPSHPSEIAKLMKPVLLMHNRDDNNINIKVPLDFYQSALKQDKANFIRLAITPSGNPTTPAAKKLNKGHHPPTSKKGLEDYRDIMLEFMTKGPSVLPAVSEWRGFREDILANKYYFSATLLEKFISEAVIFSQTNPTARIKWDSNNDTLIDTHYKPIFYALMQAETLSKNPNLLQSEIQRLENNKLLTDEVIKKLLKAQAPIFIQYVAEVFDIANLNPNTLSTNQEAVRLIKEMLTTGKLHEKPAHFINYILSTLYKENPELLEPLYPSFDTDNGITKLLQQATDQLINTQKRNKELITGIWKQTASTIVSIKAKQNVEILKNIIEEIKLHPNKTIETYQNLIRLAKLSFKDKPTVRAIIGDINKLIYHLQKSDPSAEDHTIQMNIVMALLTNAILSQFKKDSEDYKQQAIELYFNITPTSDHSDIHLIASKKEINDLINILKEGLSSNSTEKLPLSPPKLFD